ncbi:MAG: hypothetical protein KC550_05345, partial [Nanoarchaeota archaeon]|nr:hypothetical protein [Nanoarchaeota archaeon]
MNNQTSDKNKVEIFFLKNSQVFSNKTRKLQIIKEIPEFSLENKDLNLFENNHRIIKKLQWIIEEDRKTLPIGGEIQNFSQIREEIEKKFNDKKLKKKYFSKPKEDNYEFIEKTTQIEILEQIHKTINNKDLINLKNEINEYIKKKQLLENEKINDLKKQIKSLEDKIKELEKLIQIITKEEIDILNKKSSEHKKEIENLSKKKDKLQEKLDYEGKQDNISIYIDKLENKFKNIKFKIEENKLEIKILKTKVSNLDDEIKMGKKKCIKPISFILTLGLIYWTSYSDCKHYKIKLHTKANKIIE